MLFYKQFHKYLTKPVKPGLSYKNIVIKSLIHPLLNFSFETPMPLICWGQAESSKSKTVFKLHDWLERYDDGKWRIAIQWILPIGKVSYVVCTFLA